MKKKMTTTMMMLVVALLTISSLTRIGASAKEKIKDGNEKVLQDSAKKVAEHLGLSSWVDKEVTSTAVIIIPTEVEITPPAIQIIIEPPVPLPAPPLDDPVPTEILILPSEQTTCQTDKQDEDGSSDLVIAARKAGILDKYTKFVEEQDCTFGRFALMCYNAVNQETKINTQYDRIKCANWLQEKYPELRKMKYSKKLSQKDVYEILGHLQGQNPTSINLSGERTTCFESLQCLCEVFAPECLTSPR